MNSVFIVKKVSLSDQQPFELEKLLNDIQNTIHLDTKNSNIKHGFLIPHNLKEYMGNKYFFGYYSYYKIKQKIPVIKDLTLDSEDVDNVVINDMNMQYVFIKRKDGDCFMAYKVHVSDLGSKDDFEKRLKVDLKSYKFSNIEPKTLLYEIKKFNPIQSIEVKLLNTDYPKVVAQEFHEIGNIGFSLFNEFVNETIKDKTWKEDAYNNKYATELIEFLKTYFNWLGSKVDIKENFISFLREKYGNGNPWPLNRIDEAVILSAYCEEDMHCIVGGKLPPGQHTQHIYSKLINMKESHLESIVRIDFNPKKVEENLVDRILEFLRIAK